MQEPLPQSLYIARLVLVIVFLLAALAVLVFDIWAWSVWGKEAAASSLIHAWAREWPLLPLIVGMLIGHLFW